MQPFHITKFRGGLAVCLKDENEKRHRFALTAKDKKNATPEAVQIVTDFFRTPPSKITVDEICDLYKEYLGNRPASLRMTENKAIRKFFGPYRPAQITDDMVKEYRKTRVNMKTGKPIASETLWTELGALRDALSYARTRRLINSEDVPYISRPTKPAPRDRPLTKDEVSALLHEAKKTPHLFIAILLLLGTAGRVAAILELEWSRIDFVKDTIDLRVKSSETLKGRAMVPMNSGLKRQLIEWRKVTDCEFVVSFADKKVRSIRKAFTSAALRANLVDIRIHDLRHTAAVWMLEAGSSIQRISQYLGHSNLSQTFKVYARYQPNYLREEANALDVTDLIADARNDSSPK